ncbi:hypothetical protein K435DRAFT_818914 [Dendrothele bispora CBS 962.96]|uniref:Uncharacterized protein n=1 Tax=Dendrothele bispora (strain CBS 962.96) TaxID=1314807 RepID=A0A4S8M8X7_DENBC|nr:hypothetical protein K435DRAFT_818914 [Dendrothele bispora CBS 962.96]
MNENPQNPAVQDFYLKLWEHLYSRLSGKTKNITLEERDLIKLNHDRIYSHKVLHINYTTYDMRRSQDCINPRTHADVMVHSSNPEIPYWYARVLCIYHAEVMYGNKKPYRQMDFLWVHWFTIDEDQGFRLHFVDAHKECAFGFIQDPNDVVRAVHLIPAFHFGKTKSFMGPSNLGRKQSDNHEDWAKYYVSV